MPIEIRQLVIRAVADARAHGEGRAGADDDEAEGQGAAEPAGAQGDALVARCVREVLRALRKSRER